MKKPMILSLAAILFVAASSYSQSKTGFTAQAADQRRQSARSGDKNKQNQAAQSSDQSKQGNAKLTGKNQSPQSAGQSNQNTTGQIGANNGDMKPSARPGGTTHENANDVGRYSEKEDSKSMLNSKKAIAGRKKNLTEPDTTLKKGSGSARKNMKNHTGKTGNYRNQESRHNQGNH